MPKSSPEQKPKPVVVKKKSPSPVAPVSHYEPVDDPKDLVDQQLNDMQDRMDERDPKLYVDVNIGKNGMERIVVYEGDTAESLADQFCEKHKLNKDMKEKLKDEDLDDSEQERESPSQSPVRDDSPGNPSQSKDSPSLPKQNVTSSPISSKKPGV